MPESNTDPTKTRARARLRRPPLYTRLMRQRDLAAPTAIPNEEQLDKVVVVGPGPRRRRRHAAPSSPPPPPTRSAPPPVPACRENARVVSKREEWRRPAGRGRIGGAHLRGSRSGRCRIWGLRREGGVNKSGGGLIRPAHERVL